MINEKCEYYDKGFCQKGLADTRCELKGCVAHIEKIKAHKGDKV